ncbi:MAG: VanZ family protein [Turicibacter sp.]
MIRILTSCQNIEQLIAQSEMSLPPVRITLELTTIMVVTILFGCLYRRKYKEESPVKLFLITSFVFYLLNVIKVSLIPMPIDAKYIELLQQEVSCGLVEARRHNFELLDFMRWGNLFHFTTVGNFLMLAPLGIYLPILFKKQKWNLFKILLVGLSVSFCIEIIQLTYSQVTGYIYRGFNVDDLLLNTLGAVMSYFIFIWFKGTYHMVKKISSALSMKK